MKLDDVVIGRTHNSNNGVRIGIVLELIPAQGPCNVKIMLLGSWVQLLSGAMMLKADRSIAGKDGKPETLTLRTGIDYADTKELLRVKDCYRMLEAVLKYGVFDCPYFNSDRIYGNGLDCSTAEPPNID